MSAPILVLGIDPGSLKTGWGMIFHQPGQSTYLASGVIRLEAKAPLAQRLTVLHQALANNMAQALARHQPQVFHGAVEAIFHAKNSRSALVLGHARGVALLAAAQAGAQVHEYSPALVKQAVTGSGRADKDQVGRMVRALLGLPQPPAEDEADALAVALTHAAALDSPALRLSYRAP
ncbi:MAG: crossover junction endodeoxyribonuclease RuvC [Deltaproteobacteria bacterium]|nr:crossover junction endodeoxyribonuclease RuvC [Deltaproteobacteria bacterium]